MRIVRIFRAFGRCLFRHPLSEMPTTSIPRVKPTAKELATERRQHLEEQDRLQRLEYLYLQRQVIKRQGKGEESTE